MNRRDLLKAAAAAGAVALPVSLAAGALPAAAADAAWNSTGAGNPVVPGFFADPSIYVINGVHHLYTTTDGYGWDAGPASVWTSTDLVRWSNAPLTISPAPAVFWAPSLAIANGKYYLYYAKGQTGTFVAVADRPTGPFTEAAQLGGSSLIDPQPFTDDDGTTYLYYGGSSKPYVGVLGSDMISLTSTTALSVASFLEGAFAFRRGSTYYLMSSLGNTSLTNYRVVYNTGSSPFGPFTAPAAPLILSANADATIESPGHNSLLVNGDDHYIVYHRHDNPHSSDGLHRQVCVDRMTFDSAGAIVPVTPTHTGVGALPLGSPPATQTDLAAGKTVTASSVLSGFPAAYACDGNNGTRWAASDAGLPQWISVDLGAAYAIGRTETTGEFLRKWVKYLVEYSTDGSTWTTYADRTATGATGSPIVDVKPGVTARYLRLTVTGNEDSANYACLHSFKAYPAGGQLRIVNRTSGLALDVSSAGKAVQTLYTGAASQQWSLTDLGNGYYSLANRSSGKVLDVSGFSTADGADVIAYTATGGTNQQWSLTTAADGHHTLVNRNSGKVLDVLSQSTAEGAAVSQWTSNSGSNQQWRLLLP